MTIIDRILSPLTGTLADAREDARRRAELAAGGSTGPGWAGALLMAAGAAIGGAAAAMLLDPRRGRTRRARLADQGAAAVRRAARRGERLGRRVRSEIDGKIAAARAEGEGMPRPNDDVTLADRVQSEIFRDTAVPKGSLNVNVERGIVVLRGELPDGGMRQELVERIQGIEGVWSVRDLTHLPGEPAPTR